MRQLSAASRRAATCASSRPPSRISSASMATMRPCASVASSRASSPRIAHWRRSANRRTLESFQAPMAPSSISAGDGPSSPPPASAGASRITRCGPIVASAFMPATDRTCTLLAMMSSLPWRSRSGARHRVDLRGALRQVTVDPVLTAILAEEHLAHGGRAVHAPGLALVEGEGEDGGLGLDPHVHPPPARPTVRAAVEGAELALEVRTGGHPDGPGVARHLANVAAVRLPLGVQGLEPGTRPVPGALRADEPDGPPQTQ